jgi:hypothetical protein
MAAADKRISDLLRTRKRANPQAYALVRRVTRVNRLPNPHVCQLAVKALAKIMEA